MKKYLTTHDKILIILIFTILIVGLLVVLFFATFQSKPDFSKSDWYIKYTIDEPDLGVDVYWNTNDTYKVGDSVKGYNAITIRERNPNTHKPKSIGLLPLTVDRKKTNYTVSEFTSDEADVECLEIIDKDGKLVDTDGAIVTNEFIPIRDWGDTCAKIDWEAEYQKIVNLDVVTDCPFVDSVSHKIQSQTVKKVSCVMTSGISGYSNPNIIALYELESTSENNNNPWYIKVYEQDGKNLVDVLEVPGPSFGIDKVIVLHKNGNLCVLNDSGSCRLAGLISHSPSRLGYTNENGYQIRWKP